MASNEEPHVQKAEAAAKKAADELTELNKKRTDYEQECAKADFPTTPYDYHHEQSGRTGVFGTIMKSVHDRYEHTKEVITGKSHRTAELGSEYKEYTADKAIQDKDSTMDKGGEYKDYVADKAMQAKDSTMEKAGEYKDYAVEKAKEDRDVSIGKTMELKDLAEDVARRAMDFLTGRKVEITEPEKMNGDTKDKYTLNEDKARKKIQELKLEEEGHEDEEKKRAEADRKTAVDRGIAGRSNIYSAMRSTRDVIRDKITQSTDVVNETRAANELGGTKRIAGAKEVAGD